MKLTFSNMESYVSPEVSIISVDLNFIVCASGDYRETADVDDDNDLGEI